jgi:hypothetical protein
LYHIGDTGTKFLDELGLTKKLQEIIEEYAEKIVKNTIGHD